MRQSGRGFATFSGQRAERSGAAIGAHFGMRLAQFAVERVGESTRLHRPDTYNADIATVGCGYDFTRTRRFIKALHRTHGIEQVGDPLDGDGRRVLANGLKKRGRHTDRRDAPGPNTTASNRSE